MSFVQELLAVLRTDSERPLLEVMGSETRAAEHYRRKDVLHAACVLASRLKAQGRYSRAGLTMGNTPEWVVGDLALMMLGSTEVPVPLAFSAEQARSLLIEAEICLVDAQGARRMDEWAERSGPEKLERVSVDMAELLSAPVPAPMAELTPALQERISKIVHTSGTTGAPKGVKIRQQALEALLKSLRLIESPGRYERYLSILPLSLLIEQVTAIYLPVLSGGAVVLPPRGMALLGEAGGSPRAMLGVIRAARPSGMMLPPSMVELIYNLCLQAPATGDRTALYASLFGKPTPPSISTGGAPTSPRVIQALADLGIPVYEGYGLSENASIATANTPAHWRIGTVGRPLEHMEVKLAPDGELLLRGSALFAGYTQNNDPSVCQVDTDGWLHTGDLAEIDTEGFIRIRGRKKNLIITSHGRNISPEWVESQYQSVPGVMKAVVFGEGMEALEGFFAVDPRVAAPLMEQRIREFGREHLSEVERASVIFTQPATPELFQQILTITGRPRRAEIRAFMQRGLAASQGTQ
jgi:long-chain acyl-CoA synthetase